MTWPLALPAWLPWWVPVVLLVPALLYALLLVIMPFSVIGLKGRLDNLDMRLDELQGEIRSLALRLPEPSGARTHRVGAKPPEPPPIPPAPRYPMGDPSDEVALPAVAADPTQRQRRGSSPSRPSGREEPKLNWPR